MSGHAHQPAHTNEGKSDATAAAAHSQPTAAAHDNAANGAAAAPAADEPRKHPARKAAVAAAEAITAAVTGVTHDGSATAAAPASGTRKRRLSIDGGSGTKAPKTAAKGEHSNEHAAASRIQALHKQDVLWNAWNLLDWREESALMSSHGAYEALKKAVQDRKVADEAEEKKAGGSETKAKRKRAPSPSPRSKKSRSAVSDAEAEAALGLGLGDRDPLTFAWVEQMMDCFKRNQQLPSSLVLKLLARATPLLTALPNIVPVAVPARVTVVGDLHGQLDDLLAIFKLQGLPSSRSRFIFNGDFVDRGQHSVECILTLLAWKVLLPHDVFLNRGNHEARDINGRDGFEKECLQKYPGKTGTKIFDAFSACFAALPIVHIIEQQVFVIHGGLFSQPTTLADIAAIDRFHEIPPSGSLLEEGMWSDPASKRGRSESPRGAGLLFGPDVTKEFLKLNAPLNLIVRSHECMTKGFKLHHHDQVITVFSASNYTGSVGNDGALVVFERDGGTVLQGGAAVMGSPRPGGHARPGSPAMGRSASPTMGHAANAASSSAAHAAAAATPSTCPMSLRSPRLGPAKDATLHLPGPSGAASVAANSSAPIVPLKRSILPFYASRKEKNASYRVTAGSNLETDIVAKLLHLISDHRLSLIDHWSARAQQHSSGVWTVTRAVWASGLKACLGLSLPFLEFQELLGLPRLGVDGKPKGPVDFMAFLLRFRPVNLLVLRAQKNEQNAKLARSQSDAGAGQEASQDGGILDQIPSPSPSPDGDNVQPGDATVASLQQILELLHQKRFELESLFRFLDSDGNETISHDEFREGIHSLQHQLGTKFTKQQIDDLLHYIDADSDGEISYSEFFDSFQLTDPKLQSTLVRSKSIHEGVDPAAAAAAAADDEPTTPLLDDLSPQHAHDDSPPRLSRQLAESNDSSDHDSTSTSHMHNHMHTRADTCIAPPEEVAALTGEDTLSATGTAQAAEAHADDQTDEPHHKRRKVHKD